MKFLFILFCIYIAFRLISYIAIRVVAYKLKKAGMTGMSGDESKEDATSKNKKKIFKKEEGDYVDFEEIDKK